MNSNHISLDGNHNIVIQDIQGSHIYVNSDEGVRQLLAEWITTEAVGRARALKSGGVDPTVDNHLKLDHDVTAASFDWHGYSRQPEDPEHSLVWEAARNIASDWHAHSDDKFLTETGAVHPVRGAAHIAFCDVGTPKDGRTDTVYDRLRDHLVDHGVPREQIGFIHEHDQSDDK